MMNMLKTSHKLLKKPQTMTVHLLKDWLTVATMNQEYLQGMGGGPDPKDQKARKVEIHKHHRRSIILLVAGRKITR